MGLWGKRLFLTMCLLSIPTSTLVKECAENKDTWKASVNLYLKDAGKAAVGLAVSSSSMAYLIKHEEWQKKASFEFVQSCALKGLSITALGFIGYALYRAAQKDDFSRRLQRALTVWGGIALTACVLGSQEIIEALKG